MIPAAATKESLDPAKALLMGLLMETLKLLLVMGRSGMDPRKVAFAQDEQVLALLQDPLQSRLRGAAA